MRSIWLPLSFLILCPSAVYLQDLQDLQEFPDLPEGIDKVQFNSFFSMAKILIPQDHQPNLRQVIVDTYLRG